MAVSDITSYTHYTEQQFRDVLLDQTTIAEAEFYSCTFTNCSFVESVFQRCRFVECAFRQSDTSLMQVPGSAFSATSFANSKILGVDWTRAEWSAAGQLESPLSFVECAISHSTFIGLALRRIRIRDCIAVDVDFREADLSSADLVGTDLADSLFVRTNLTQADLRRARNYRIDPAQNTIRQAKFSFPEAMELLYSMDIVLTDKDP